ncbi:MAG TPA: hypothetical protein VMA98_06565 [Candidatus Acidoferrales bacterium]|nr:hypothetical protein [Candidatus Acidoferrales bacterium]
MNARVAVFGALVVTALVACSSGSGGYTPPSGTLVSVSPPATESTSAAISTTSTTTVQFDTLSNGTRGSITLPEANAAATATLGFDAAIPSGVATPSLTAPKLRATIGGSNLQVLGVVSLTVSSTISVATTPAFSFTLSSAPTGDAYVAYYNEQNTSAGWNVLLGPGTASGNTISFPAQSISPPFTLTAGDTYLFALVVSSTAAPTPAAAYSGTKSVNWVYGFAFGCTCTALPETTAPPATIDYTVASTVTTGSSPYPSGSVNALDVHTVENDSSNLATTTLTTDSWMGAAQSGGVYDELLYGSTQQEPSSADEPVITTTYVTPEILDEIPEANNATWTNSPAQTIDYSYSTGESGVRTYAADGSYTDTESILSGGAGGNVVTTVNADGSGSITFPTPPPGVLSSPTPYPYYAGAYVAGLTVAAPSGGNIAMNFNYTAYAQSCCGYPATAALSDPTWYPTPVALYTESDAIATGVTFPSGCGTANGTSGNEVTRSISQLDTVIGFIETTTFNTYTANGYPVCIVSNDVVNYAYDWQNNQPYTFYYGSLGTEVQTTSETIALQSGSSQGASLASSRGSTIALALESHELTGFARARGKFIRTVIASIRSTTAKPVSVTRQGGRP